jgi:hypothetical protein
MLKKYEFLLCRKFEIYNLKDFFRIVTHCKTLSIIPQDVSKHIVV